MKKLLIALTVSLMAGGLYAACIGPLCYDDSGTSTLSGNVAVGGVMTVGVVDVTVSTPTVVGQMARTSSNILYIATATVTTGSWQKVGAQ